jgi:hypothetical protein
MLPERERSRHRTARPLQNDASFGYRLRGRRARAAVRVRARGRTAAILFGGGLERDDRGERRAAMPNARRGHVVSAGRHEK